MKKDITRYLWKNLCVLLILLPGVSAFASHIVGADLYYTHVSGNTYRISMALYGDCGTSTTAFPTLAIATPQICIYDGSTNVGTIFLAIDTTMSCGTEITPLCPGDTSQCTSLTYTTPGIQKFVYTGTYTLPHTSANWRFI